MQKGLQVIFFLIFSLYLISCQEETNPCLLSKAVLKDIQTLDSLTKRPEIRQRDIVWMKQNYNEPSLLNAKTETYRFIWFSSFDTTKICRIEEINGLYKLTKKVFSSHRDTIGSTNEFIITKNDWNSIVNNLAGLNFWTYPHKVDRKGLDGATWILEGYKPIKDKCTLKNYHMISRWSPTDTTFISMCDLLYKLREK
jgi:hypothetical protein